MTVPKAIGTLIIASLLVLSHYLFPATVTVNREIGQVLETIDQLVEEGSEGGVTR